MINVEHSFLGTGWSFPPAFDNTSAAVKMVSNEEDIAQSLQILLSTRPGERVMLPQYGCNLDVFLFESITTTLVAYVKELIQTAILYYEPRITLDLITIDTDRMIEGVILIELQYTVLASNSRFNLVYPFYLNESAVV
jgi:phage baseplate assembly protein W